MNSEGVRAIAMPRALIGCLYAGGPLLLALGCRGGEPAAAAAEAPVELAIPHAAQVVAEHASPTPAAVTGGPVGPPASVAVPEACTRICQHTVTLKCGGADECQKGCAEMFTVPACSNQMSAFLHCLEKEPVEHWECDADTAAAAIRDGYCKREQAAFFRCLTE
jgi:hypothetical protein